MACAWVNQQAPAAQDLCDARIDALVQTSMSKIEGEDLLARIDRLIETQNGFALRNLERQKSDVFKSTWTNCDMLNGYGLFNLSDEALCDRFNRIQSASNVEDALDLVERLEATP